MEICRQCRQPSYCDHCGLCIRHGEPRKREVATRQWVVRVRWLVKRRGQWTAWVTCRVTARGPLGAMTHGHNALKTHRPKRLHIVQTSVELLPMTGGKGGLTCVTC